MIKLETPEKTTTITHFSPLISKGLVVVVVATTLCWFEWWKRHTNANEINRRDIEERDGEAFKSIINFRFRHHRLVLLPLLITCQKLWLFVCVCVTFYILLRMHFLYVPRRLGFLVVLALKVVVFLLYRRTKNASFSTFCTRLAIEFRWMG